MSNVFLERNKFGLNICPPSIKFTQCQTVLRHSLKVSPNDSLKDLWKSSSCHTNIQYDVNKSTKEVLKDLRSNQEDKLQHQLTSQGFFFSNLFGQRPSLIYQRPITILPSAASTTPSVHVRIWQDGDYHKVLISPFTLIQNHSFYVVAGCQQYLDRFTWRHDSIFNFIAESLQPIINVHSSLYADIKGFLIPSIITGEHYRPDLLLRIQSKCLYVLELTVGFESNVNNSAVRKKEKYLNLIKEMSRNYRCVKFVNFSMSSLGVFSDECSTFLDMMNDIGIDKKQQRYIIKKMINIAIRATYYIFCCRNRNWDSPDLMQF